MNIQKQIDKQVKSTPETAVTPSHITEKIETYLKKYVHFSDEAYSFPIALWIIGTYLWPDFDAFPYLVITSDTKRSGKTRLSELVSFACSNPLNSAAMSAAGMFRSIEDEQPTIFFDEAEVLSSEGASTMRAVLNVGYRKGQTVRRMTAAGVKDFPTYCPKVFILIGDVFDTLKDRSIIVRMRRGEVPCRFVYDQAKAEGGALREEISDLVEEHRSELLSAFDTFSGITFLTDRDEEIWTPLFTICGVFAKDRTIELDRTAVDMATEKTQKARKFVNLADEEAKADEAEYSKRLLIDIASVFTNSKAKAIASHQLVEDLKAIPTAPWRRYKGEGLTALSMSSMLSVFGIRPSTIRLTGRKDGNKTIKGYKGESIIKAASQF